MSLDSILRNPGKNLIPYPYAYTTQKISGITFTVSSDGSVTVNGTATANAVFELETNLQMFTLPAADYFLSGCPSGGSTTSYFMTAVNGAGISYDKFQRDFGTGVAVPSSGENWKVSIRIMSGYTANNLVFKPQIELGTTATDYEPYHLGPETVTIPSNSQNLITFPYEETTQTIEGITFTVNDNGSINVTGTSTDSAIFIIKTGITLEIGKQYTLSGYREGSNAVMRLIASNDSSTAYMLSTQYQTQTFTATYSEYILTVSVNNETTVDATFYPQLEEGITATDFSLNTGDKEVYKVSYGSKNLIDTSWAVYDGAVTNYPQFTNVSTDILSQVDKLPRGVPLIVSANISVTGSTAGYERNLVLVDQNNNKVSYYINDVGGTLQNKEIPTSFGKATYVYLYLGQNSTANISNLQIEIGSTATSYTPYSREQVWKSTSYNLLPNPTSATQTITGITFTNNSDGTITVNGTANANSTYNLGTFTIPTNYELKLSGCPTSGSTSSYYLYAYDTTANKSYNDTGNGITFTNTSGSINIYIRVQNEQTVDNLVFKPKLEFV